MFSTGKNKEAEVEFIFNIGTNTKTDIDFMSAFKIFMRKTAYCILCKVCESNCPHGYITMKSGKVKIDDRCVKCRKCYDIFYGCLLANSMRLPKGESKMGSINRYGNMGVDFDWLRNTLTQSRVDLIFGHRVIPLERIKLNISKVSFRIVE